MKQRLQMLLGLLPHARVLVGDMAAEVLETRLSDNPMVIVRFTDGNERALTGDMLDSITMDLRPLAAILGEPFNPSWIEGQSIIGAL